MKTKTNAIIAISIIVVLAILIAIGNIYKKPKTEEEKIQILTSFYPIYIMTINITNGVEDIEVSNMADNVTTCIHDYTLTTSDLRKFENTDIFIQNGAYLEKFSEKILESYPNVDVINATDDIGIYIKNEEGEINSHIWLGINNYIREVSKITDRLCQINSKNSEKYNSNAYEYFMKLKDVKSKFDELNLKGKKAICLNESLEYLLVDNGIDETMIETDHEQASLSAEQIKVIIEKMKAEDIRNIFIDKNDDTKTADMLASETNAKIYVLDSNLSGNNDLNSYIDAMEYNYEILKSMN